MRTKPLALSAAAVLMLTACGDGDGLGNTEALSDVELHVRDDDQPEVILHSPVESDDGASRVLNAGDGDQVEDDHIVEFRQVAASPESGDVLGHNFGDPIPQMAWMPSIQETGQDIDEFFYDALTAEGVTIGSDVAIYYPAAEDGLHDQQLAVFRLVDQYPVHADGELQEQSGDLPEVTNEIGEAPELVDHDGDSEAPEELTTEVLIEGDGAEIAEEDHLYVQYRGWQWDNGEEFDGSWPEDGEAGVPADFPLQGVIEGWTEGIAGQNVGDRLLLVIPPEQAYGEAEDEEGLTEGGQPGGHLIFVVDVVQAISPEDVPEPEQPQEQQMPDDISEEELQELLEQMEQGEAEQGEAEEGDAEDTDEQQEED